ncbi:MAG: hypothetical protein ACI38U_15065 [Corynebacterium sp.]|uniref:hypothetical protein n=1 Tax=unclassified Corynebacterium TaxID=2624378 RepID=UPI0009627FD4|nr:hypothetical protein [Corynebacterium sp. CNJ-954]OLT53683.1 hypothetical protein BJF89_02350 [Corynebacterium sp. CNJ-954]
MDTGFGPVLHSQFCALFAEHVRRHDLFGAIPHEPGRAMLVDWAGGTISITDEFTGTVTRAILFVAVLPPYSGALSTHAYPDMKIPAWLGAHSRAFAFFGGTPQIVVPDNPTIATLHPTRWDSAPTANIPLRGAVNLVGDQKTTVAVRPTGSSRSAPRSVLLPGYKGPFQPKGP